MRALGADPSSTSAGFALIDGTQLVVKDVWKPPKKATRPQQLLAYYDHALKLIRMWEPDVAVVLRIMKVRGAKTVRALSYFEGTTLLALARCGVVIYQIDDATARHAVLGVPVTASKEEALAKVRERYPDIRWSPVNQGGPDEADAFVAALAWRHAAAEHGKAL